MVSVGIGLRSIHLVICSGNERTRLVNLAGCWDTPSGAKSEIRILKSETMSKCQKPKCSKRDEVFHLFSEIACEADLNRF